jgi:hypothetical protein
MKTGTLCLRVGAGVVKSNVLAGEMTASIGLEAPFLGVSGRNFERISCLKVN